MTIGMSSARPVRQRRAVVVVVAGRRLALPAETVVEVGELESFTPLPCDDPAHVGVGLYRDRVVPVVDLVRHAALDIPSPAVTAGAVCVIARTLRGEVAFPIDSVVGLEASDRGDGDTAIAVDPNRRPGSHGEDRPR
jgi:chemotaxis signal transduction protein